MQARSFNLTPPLNNNYNDSLDHSSPNNQSTVASPAFHDRLLAFLKSNNYEMKVKLYFLIASG